jgi:hypothetical protein
MFSPKSETSLSRPTSAMRGSSPGRASLSSSKYGSPTVRDTWELGPDATDLPAPSQRSAVASIGQRRFQGLAGGAVDGVSPYAIGGITMDDMPLSSANARAQLAHFEAEQVEADQRAHERRLHEQVLMRRGDAERAKDVARFDAQETFRWSVPEDNVPPCDMSRVPDEYSTLQDVSALALADGTGVQPAVIAGFKHRPKVIAAPPDLPDCADAIDPAEMESGEGMARLQLTARQVATVRRAAEFDMEESLFAAGAMSSDDSEGYDPDVAEDWRESTSDLFSVCRRFETTDHAGEAEASALAAYLRERRDFAWNATEQHLIWDTVRHCYHRAEPLHRKRWLQSLHELHEEGGFRVSPSVALFAQLVFAAVEVVHLPEHVKRKLRRWANRSTYLVRRRVAVLRELGVHQPTWAQVKASVSGLDRHTAVPGYTLRDALLLVCGDADGDIRVAPEEELAAEEVAARVHEAADAERAEAIKLIMASGEAEDRLPSDDDDDAADGDPEALIAMMNANAPPS